MSTLAAKPTAKHNGDDELLALVRTIPDPEIPVLTLGDLGIIRFLKRESDAIVVGVAPTYSACPATEVIEGSVVAALHKAGVADARVERVMSPPWTTDWITADGRSKLKEYGIAPPASTSGSKRALLHDRPAACPRCDSTNTTRVSEFGSTPCKASYKCADCLEPFEYFKCL